MSRGTFRSASGLRPTTAFFGVAIVLLVILVRAALLAAFGHFEQPRRVVEETLPEPDFDILDRARRTLARSVQRLDLCMSPRAMWQAHTPRAMAEKLSAALEGALSAGELLARMLPDAQDGVIRVQDPALELDFDAARRVHAWLGATGLEGLWLERAEHPARWTIAWKPELVLSAEARERHKLGREAPGPMRWARRLALDLGRCLTGEEPPKGESAAQRELARRHERIWRALVPSADRTVLEGLDAAAAGRVAALLDAEGVDQHQMRVEFRCERRYPVREIDPQASGFAILGSWRYLSRPEALRMAAAELGMEHPEEASGGMRALFDRRVGRLLDHKHPGSGLEGLASALLSGEGWSFASGEPARYRFRRDWPVHKRPRRYYVAHQPEGETPRVVTTIDSALQLFLRRELEALLTKHEPALAMGIAIDVQTGDVLAIDGASPYGVSEFLPTWHLFTPGSTFKVLVMGIALNEGVVTPGERFDTHDGNFHVPGSRRVIREAEGPPGGWREAREALAYSINAVMAQIGMRVPARTFRERLTRLGYGRAPRAGVGGERAGHVPALPWKEAYAHASVSFGHELAVSLWQHATGLADVMRGGEHVPLRLLSAVEWEGRSYEVERPAPERVLSREACEEVRRMMELGAAIGTGRDLWRRVAQRGTPLALATKTGTAEKVPSEVCLHLELERNRHNAGLARDDPRYVSFEALRGQPKPHGRKSCYTSSIVVTGSVPGIDREVLVMIVVDEPRSRAKYGSEVAGPAAMAVLEEALGLTIGGRAPADDGNYVPPTDYGSLQNPWDRPWSEDASTGQEGGARW